MTLCLTSDELVELTHKRRYSSQRAALNAMGIDYKPRPDGTLVVLRSALENSDSTRQRKRTEPDLEAVA